MGFFSWLTCDTNESISNRYSVRGPLTAYVLIPKEFGGGCIKETNYEVATVDDFKVVHRRNEDKILVSGKEYYRKTQGRMSKWLRVTSEKTLNR